MDRDWTDIPENVLSSILLRLFCEDRHSFSLVCKSWHQTSKYSLYGHSPCLMYHDRDRGWILYQYNSSISMHESINPPKAKIHCVKYGWMLMSREDNYNMFFFNPFNKETICLPKPPLNYYTIGFFYPPTSNNCFIVGISTSLRNVSIGFLKKEKNKWHARVYDNDTNFRLSMCTPVLHQGLLYFLDVYGEIATFNIDKYDSWDASDECLSPPKLRPKIVKHFLVSLNDVLLAVLVIHEEMIVKVFRMVCEPSMKWEAVEDLGNNVLFVSHTASFAATSTRESMANRIYFTKMHDDDYVYYSLKDQKYHSRNSDYTRKKSYGYTDVTCATWIVAAPTPEIPTNLIWCSNLDVS